MGRRPSRREYAGAAMDALIAGALKLGKIKYGVHRKRVRTDPQEGMRMELLELMTAKSLGGVRKERRQKHLRINFTLSCTMPIHEMRERYLVKWS